jgi:hypothetical protein
MISCLKKQFVLMNENGKMRPIEIVPGIQRIMEERIQL